jgi:hypothetical protein
MRTARGRHSLRDAFKDAHGAGRDLQIIAENRISEFKHEVQAKHSSVLKVFAERMATAAVRDQAPDTLLLALIALLLAWAGPDERDLLLVFPLVYDAAGRLDLDKESFFGSVSKTVGDQVYSPWANFLGRSEHNKSLEVMGYTVGSDKDGFRYKRNW